MLTLEQQKQFTDAFVKPVAMTWDSQFRRELVIDRAGPDVKPPTGLMTGAMLSINGTTEGYVAYFFSEQSSRLAVDEFQSRPLTPGGDPALGAISDAMRMITSNAALLMRETTQSADIKLVKVFTSESFGLDGDEKWTGIAHLHSRADARSIFGSDDVYVFVQIDIAEDEPGDHMERLKAMMSRAQRRAVFAAGVTAGVGAAGAPPLPVPGVDQPEEFDHLKASVLKARRVYVVDSEKRIRIAINTRDDGSATVIMADKEGRMRATVAISNKGVSRIMFLDRYGRRAFVAPTRTKAAKDVRKRAMRLAERRMKSAEGRLEAETAEERALIEAVTSGME